VRDKGEDFRYFHTFWGLVLTYHADRLMVSAVPRANRRAALFRESPVGRAERRALANPPGLAGIADDLSLPTLLAAYRRGLYPLAHVAPLKWWSPPQRSLLFFRNFHISNNLARLMRQHRYSVTFDRDFEAVIAACAGRRPGR
jgi:hypothetical protein